MKYKVFGCKVNKYYTDKWLNSDYLKDKSGVFIASCVVTSQAKRKWLKFLSQEIPKLENNQKIYISWCWAFEAWKENKNFFEIYKELKIYKDKIEILPENPSSLTPLPEGEGKIKFKLPKINLTTKKFLLIQGWCDNYCTFCLTVKKRWKYFFRSKEDIVDEIVEFEKIGWKEIVLTWINLWAWWSDNTNNYKNSKFDELLRYIIQKTEIQRIRISSLWPEFINNKILKIFSHKRIYPYFHLSIQSWSSSILSSMKRHYDNEYLQKIFKKINSIKREDLVDISIWADLIVWFPWETEKDFSQTCNLVQKHNITKLHVFPFSNHDFQESVPATFFPNQIDEKTKKQRVSELIAIWNEVRNNFIISQKWKILNVLIENIKDWNWKWWSENYIECDNSNFEIISWNISKNEILTGFLKN